MKEIPNNIIIAIENFLYDTGYHNIMSIFPTEHDNTYEVYIKQTQGRSLFYTVNKQKIKKYVILNKIKKLNYV